MPHCTICGKEINDNEDMCEECRNFSSDISSSSLNPQEDWIYGPAIGYTYSNPNMNSNRGSNTEDSMSEGSFSRTYLRNTRVMEKEFRRLERQEEYIIGNDTYLKIARILLIVGVIFYVIWFISIFFFIGVVVLSIISLSRYGYSGRGVNTLICGASAIVLAICVPFAFLL